MKHSEIEEKLVEHQCQLDRIISDCESEKDTRNRVFNDMEQRIRNLEAKSERGIGMIIATQVVIGIVITIAIALLNHYVK